MGTTIDLERPRFPVPAGLVEVDDREEGDRILVLYGGHIALLDVIKKPGDGTPPEHLLRIETERENAFDLLHHPALFTKDRGEALEYFDPR